MRATGRVADRRRNAAEGAFDVFAADPVEVAEEFEAVANGDGSADDAAAELEGARSALAEALSSDTPSPELIRAALEAVTEALSMLGSDDEVR